MSAVRTQDILLRVGGRTLQRLGVLAAAGAGRGYVELKETFTRGSTLAFRDQDGIGRKAAIDKVAIEYPGELSGLVDQFGYRFCGPRSNVARTQLVTDPENFGAWTVTGIVGRTGGQADPFGGTAAYLLDSDTPSTNDGVSETVSFTGNATKAFACFMRAGSSVLTRWTLSGAVVRHEIHITWTAGVPSLSTADGGGTLFPVESWGGGWYRVAASATGVIATDTNTQKIDPDANGGGGTVYVFGANAWDAPFPSSYQGPSGGASPSVAGLLTVPFNWGTSRDISVLTRVARPVWVAASGDIGGDKYAWELSTAVAKLALHGKTATRDWRSIIDTSVTDSTVDTAIPAGNELRVLSQFKTLVAGGQVAQDVGSGLSGFGSVASAAAAYGNQTLRIGGGSGTEFDGVLLDALFVDGQHTKAELEAVE